MSYFDFYGNKDPFSNFYPCLFIINGIQWTSVEQYFQAQKFDITSKEYQQILSSNSPAIAKKIGQGGILRSDWELVKEDIMYTALYEKFKDPELKEYLIETGNKIIRETSQWDYHIGKNRLGITLMKLRFNLGYSFIQ